MITKYREGKVPSPGTAMGDEDVRNLSARVIRDYCANFDDYSFSRALENIWELIARVNKYIVENEPWAIAEKPAESGRLDSVLFHSAEALRIISVLLAAAMPQTAQAIWEQLGLEGQVRQFVWISWSGRTFWPASPCGPVPRFSQDWIERL